MKLISADVTDFGNTTDVVCTDAASISYIGDGLVRITFTCRRQDPEGRTGNVVVCEQVWGKASLFVALETLSSALMEMAMDRPRVVTQGAVH